MLGFLAETERHLWRHENSWLRWQQIWTLRIDADLLLNDLRLDRVLARLLDVVFEVRGLFLVLIRAICQVEISSGFLVVFAVKKKEFFVCLFRILSLELVEVLLSVGPSLRACPRPNVLVDSVPVLTIELESLKEPRVLLVGPAACVRPTFLARFVLRFIIVVLSGATETNARFLRIRNENCLP